MSSLPEAEDVFQDAFIRIFDKIHLYNSEQGNFDGWIYRVTVNTALAALRQKKSLNYKFSDGEDIEIEHVSLPNDLELEDLKKMIDLLPAGQRVVFNLYMIEGYSHKEIAEMLEISAVGSKSQLSRAKTYLRKKYNELNRLGESID